MIWAAYGYGSLDTETFFQELIITGASLAPSSVSVGQQQSETVQVTALRADRQQAEGLAPGQAVLAWSRTSAAFTITSSSSTSVTVRGDQVDSGYVKAKLSSENLPNARLGTLASIMGDSAKVVVHGTVPPPTGVFAVTGINGAPMPITQAGEYILEAVVANQPGFDLFIRWEIAYSNGVLGPFDTGTYYNNFWRLEVREGSYTITVKATPRSNSKTGRAFIQDFPVCTGGGGGGPQTMLSDRRKPEPTRVGGC